MVIYSYYPEYLKRVLGRTTSVGLRDSLSVHTNLPEDEIIPGDIVVFRVTNSDEAYDRRAKGIGFVIGVFFDPHTAWQKIFVMWSWSS
jgi:hypothetical protein